MTMLNEYEKYPDGISKDDYRVFLHLLNPTAPHITEELNEEYNLGKPLCESYWPTFDEAKTIDNIINLPIQFNGKLKRTIKIELDSPEDVVKQKVHESVNDLLSDKTIIKEIYVKNRIYNIVVK